MITEKQKNSQDLPDDYDILPTTAPDHDRTIYLFGDVEEDNIMGAISGILSFIKRDKTKPIEIIINTYGGSVHEMFGLYDVITYAKSIGVPIYTLGLGKVMSAGILLLCSGTKGRRVVGAHTRLMFHGGSQGCEGTVQDMQNEAKEAKQLEDLANNRVFENSKMTKKQIESICNANISNTYINPEQAIKYGLVDQILGKEKNVPKPKRKYTRR